MLSYKQFVANANLAVTNVDRDKVVIYALIDLTTDCVRYVGKSTQKRFGYRMWQHYNSSKNHVGHWIHSINQQFTWIILDVVEELNWSFWEKWWISQFKIWEQPLTNLTEGGDGVPINDTIRKKMSAAQKKRAERGDYNKESFRKNLSESMKRSYQQMRDQGDSLTRHSDISKRKISESIKKIQSDPDSWHKSTKFAEERSRNTSKGWETRRKNKIR